MARSSARSPSRASSLAPAQGTQILDVRPIEAFAAGHYPGALSVPVSGTRFSTKAAFVLDAGRHHHRRVGRGRGRPRHAVPALGRTPRHRRLRARRRNGGARARLDRAARRTPRERGRAHRRAREGGARLGLHRRQPQHPVPPAARSARPISRATSPIVTICETGPRAVIAASILAAHGFDAHPVVNGGIDSWVAAGNPTVEFRRCGS